MESNSTMKIVSRRDMLRTAAALTGGALAAGFNLAPQTQAAADFPQQQPHNDALTAMRAQFGKNPIVAQELTDNLTMLSGPGGNVIVLHGPDGKLMVDTFVQSAWAPLQNTLNGIGKEPVKTVIDTHWHFDHADNNSLLRGIGATIVAHDNTKKRLSEPHFLAVLNMNFPATPEMAWPQQTFKESRRLQTNGETIVMTHVPPAHTDSDLFVHFEKANVMHGGDVFGNRIYPYIDGGTGGSINGMIAGAEKLLAMTDNNTKIVPGHGPLANKADLKQYRDMLVTVRDRVQKLKSSGKSIQEAVAAKPLADLDPVWGKALFNGDGFVQIVYLAS